MDVLNTYGLLFGGVLAVLAAGATFFNKQRFEAQNALLQAGNDELRNQIKDIRDQRTDLVSANAALEARSEEKERIINELKRQPNLTHLTKIISNNHTEVVTSLAQITKVLVEQNNVPKRR